MEKNDKLEKRIEIKIILIGEAGVGKTCIINRYINHRFDEDTINTISTSCEQKTIILNDKNKTGVDLNIWDTCGQEKFRNLVNILFQNAKAAILVYDSTSLKTFNQIKEFWYNKVKECAPEDIGNF